jgi:phosphomannomutase
LHVLAALGSQDGPLSSLLSEYARYRSSGEINREVRDQQAVTQQVRAAFAGTDGVWMDELDGLTVARDGWWFNLRPSNTEPLLRLNVEAPDDATLIDVRDQVLRIVHRDAD